MTRPVAPAGAAHSYRSDPSVPAFQDDRPVIVFDGHCALCTGWVRFVMALDRAKRFRFLPAQSVLGRALYVHYGLDPEDYETNLLVEDGVARFRMDGTVRMAEILGFPWTLARCVRVLPTRVQDALYGFVARNRFRIMGRRQTCHIPDPADADRFLA